MKRLLALLLMLLCLCSCSNKESTKEILRDFLSSPLTVTTKNEDFSFEITGNKITITYPEMLKGTEIIFEKDKITTTLYGQNITLPESSVRSVKTILDAIEKIKSTTSEYEEKDGCILFENCTLELKDSEVKINANEKDFTIKRRTDNEKNNSNSESESNQRQPL